MPRLTRGRTPSSENMFAQVISVIGSLIILGAYFALQRGLIDSRRRTYSALNFVGAGLLAWVAVVESQVGFILLEGTWALLSIPGMLRGTIRTK